jgi:hypothetical protein
VPPEPHDTRESLRRRCMRGHRDHLFLPLNVEMTQEEKLLDIQ